MLGGKAILVQNRRAHGTTWLYGFGLPEGRARNTETETMTTITAAVLDRCGDNPRPYAQSRPLALAELTLDPPRPGELLVRIDAAGLCHSDLSVVNGDRPRPMPMAIGHEATGDRRGGGRSAATGFAVGDRVILAFLPACGDCVRCRSGEAYMCAVGAAANGEGRLLGGGCRLHDGEQDVKHHLGVSAFATHAVVDRRSAVKVDADITPEIAALFGCAVLTGVGAVMNSARVRPGESAVVYGLGGVGLAALLGCARAARRRSSRSIRSPTSARSPRNSARSPCRPRRPRRRSRDTSPMAARTS